jgi:hypothetical protein
LDIFPSSFPFYGQGALEQFLVVLPYSTSGSGWHIRRNQGIFVATPQVLHRLFNTLAWLGTSAPYIPGDHAQRKNKLGSLNERNTIWVKGRRARRAKSLVHGEILE